MCGRSADVGPLLAEIERPLPVCADESCHDRASLSDLTGKYDMVNIKLDKTGGLTEALALALLHDGHGSALVTQAVAGMGGVGKTQLAVEYAYRYGRYYRGVHWLNAARPEALGAEVLCGPFYQPLGTFSGVPPTVEEKARGVEVRLPASRKRS